MKYLGIDYGLKKIGLAVGEKESKTAMPLEVKKWTMKAPQEIAELITEEMIDAVVVGMPEQAQGEITQEFVKELKAQTHVPVFTLSEAYTSVASKQIQTEQGSGVAEDALAAMIILQEYFDKQ